MKHLQVTFLPPLSEEELFLFAPWQSDSALWLWPGKCKGKHSVSLPGRSFKRQFLLYCHLASRCCGDWQCYSKTASVTFVSGVEQYDWILTVLWEALARVRNNPVVLLKVRFEVIFYHSITLPNLTYIIKQLYKTNICWMLYPEYCAEDFICIISLASHKNTTKYILHYYTL